MTTAIVHIGFNKCGSTAIQTWLADNRAALADQGIAYQRTDPREDTICTNPQFTVVAYSRANRAVWPRKMNEVLGIKDGDRTSQDAVAHAFSAKFAQWAATQDGNAIVISCEALAPRLNTVETVKALDSFLREHVSDVRYVVYIRQPTPWLVSLYGHTQRKGSADASFDALLDRRIKTPFGPALDIWRDAVGADCIDLRLFDENWLSQDGLIADFCTAIGADMTRTNTTKTRMNTSFRDGPWVKRLLASRKLKRPRPDAALQARINAANADQMARIKQTFFEGREQLFNTWLNSTIKIPQ